MKVVYDKEKIETIVSIMNGLEVKGIEMARRVAMIAAMLEEGKIMEEEDGSREHS